MKICLVNKFFIPFFLEWIFFHWILFSFYLINIACKGRHLVEPRIPFSVLSKSLFFEPISYFQIYS